MTGSAAFGPFPQHQTGGRRGKEGAGGAAGGGDVGIGIAEARRRNVSEEDGAAEEEEEEAAIPVSRSPRRAARPRPREVPLPVQFFPN